MIVLLIAAVVALAYIFYRINKKDDTFWKHILAIPGPKSYPIFGTEIHFDSAEDVFKRDRQLAKMYHPIYQRHSLPIAVVNLIAPEDIELILNNSKHIEKSAFYDFLHSWLGNGLLTSKGANWHKRRKILTPAFHFNILQEFVDIFNKEVNHLVDVFKTKCDQPIDLIKPITEFTLYSIGETSLGKDLREEPSCDEYKQAVYEYGENFVYRMVRPWLFMDTFFNMTKVGKRNQEIVKVLHDFSNGIIAERYKLFKKDGTMSYSERKRLALLDLMIKAKYNGADIDDVGIREEVDTFILGGHDTTSISLCHTLMILANNPDIQEEMYQEAIAVVENPKNPTYTELGELKYIERCIKESLRLYPSAPTISRVAGEEVHTKTGYTIPKSAVVTICIYDTHHSPHYYENPEKFDPDRFLPENIASRHPYAYIPFSAGSRNCIGQKYAMLELKAALCGILCNFKLEPVTKPSEIIHKADIVLRPSNEIKVKFVLRTQKK
ncbi:unnamed protein product [Diabrotica balteata]|uniref:Cytochrome P450 n=1 Tax=Diabrotica balteata TaxID=107213 RepID=A0A9N9SWK2_DIABA|nr:unnamed protein product [Diabrotica balteata]